MTVKEAAFKLEELQAKVWILNSLTLAVKDAIIGGPNDVSSFEGALHMLTCITHELEGEMGALKDALLRS